MAVDDTAGEVDHKPWPCIYGDLCEGARRSISVVRVA